MIKRILWPTTLLAVLLVLVACGGVLAQPETAAGDSQETTAAGIENAPIAAVQAAEKYGLIAGPVTDRGFNQLAWAGLQRAADELGVQVEHLESNQATAAENMAQFVDEGYSGIIAVGFGLAPTVKSASLANPQIPFVNIDFPSQTANDLGVLFSTDQPAFLAGYLAAGMTETGVVCTYGGTQVPPVLIFMVGFEHGVKYYNEQNGANVQVLGWRTDPTLAVGGEGIFAGNYSSQADGQAIAADLFDQGCDIIFPVAGGVGLGSAQEAQARGLTVIGVDADQTQTAPEYQAVYLTSVLKKIDAVVFEAVNLIHSGTYQGGANFVGSLANNGVGLAPFHNFEASVPQQLKNELAQLEQGIIDGTISTGWPIMPAGTAMAAMTAKAAIEARLTPQMLQNATYPSEWTASGSAQLTGGQYEEEIAPGSASKIQIQMLDTMAYGDLDGDGFADAAVILVTNGGGSGSFYELFAVLDRQGQPAPVASAMLGDRIQVNSLMVQPGQIVVDMLTQGPGDAMAGPPTQAETRTYQMKVSLELTSGAVTSTEVINYTPTEIPSETQAGSCWTNAIGLDREDAYRCMVGNQIFDPCFVVDEQPTVVCGADPTTGETGFVLELTQPLPPPDVGNLAMPWLIELADGTICGLMTGTRPVVDDRPATYGCADQTYLFDDFQQGEVWLAEQAKIGLGDDGFFIEESEIVPLKTVWQ